MDYDEAQRQRFTEIVSKIPKLQLVEYSKRLQRSRVGDSLTTWAVEKKNNQVGKTWLENIQRVRKGQSFKTGNTKRKPNDRNNGTCDSNGMENIKWRNAENYGPDQTEVHVRMDQVLSSNIGKKNMERQADATDSMLVNIRQHMTKAEISSMKSLASQHLYKELKTIGARNYDTLCGGEGSRIMFSQIPWHQALYLERIGSSVHFVRKPKVNIIKCSFSEEQ